ncbi:hypothetical protein OIU79_005110 [Salix purpurea]|uniref:DUF674 family protein n=1 Tax=Salix purpurea TaxID=77065 RepID=A0A9Q0UBZ2_SALPP|nr:hypothetical protein OIU79_005110 [Salix purpurea]
MGNPERSLKLLIDTNGNKVVFAETGKNFVDFLLHLLALPVGTVMRLLKKSAMAGCIANLYDSLESLDESYMQPNKNKDSLLYDLSLSPMSMVSVVGLLNKFNIKDFGLLKEKVVGFGIDEGIKLLGASLLSKDALTAVFLLDQKDGDDAS